MHLRRYILSTDIGIVAGEGVALQAEGADPDLRTHVDIAERIEDGSARWLANDRLILKKWFVEFFQRSKEGAIRM